MKQWAELEAENILDAFVRMMAPDDVLRLQGAIGQALYHFYELGRDQNRFPLKEFNLIDDSLTKPNRCPCGWTTHLLLY